MAHIRKYDFDYARRHFMDGNALIKVNHRQGRAFLIGDIETAAGLIQREGFRA